MVTPIDDISGEEAFVFVSYAHSDVAIAGPEIEFLQRLGWRTWFDADIHPGGEWRDEIAAAIRNAKLLIYFMTPNSVSSIHCRREVLFALDVNTKVLPVYLVPTHLPDGLSFVLSDRQAISRHNLEDQEYISQLDLAAESGSRSFEPQQARAEEMEDGGLSSRSSALLLVLPPELRGVSDELEFFFDGLTEDLIAGLARSKWTEVVDSALSGRFSTTNTDPLVAANQAGATYLLKGKIAEASHKVRGRFELLNVRTNRVVWSTKVNADSEALFDIEEEVLLQLISAIEPEMLNDQGESTAIQSSERTGWQKLMFARHLFWKTTRTSTMTCRGILNELLEIHGPDARILSLLAMSHLNDYWHQWSDSPRESLLAADNATREAMKLSGKDAYTYFVRSVVSTSQRDVGQAEADLRASLDINPYFAAAHGDLTRILAFAGKTKGSVVHAEKALKACPSDPHAGLWSYGIALAYFVDEDYSKALDWLEKTASIRPDWSIAHILKAVCHALCGDVESGASLIQNVPESSLRRGILSLDVTHPFAHPEPLSRIRRGLDLLKI